jgi:hypothetical protein
MKSKLVYQAIASDKLFLVKIPDHYNPAHHPYYMNLLNTFSSGEFDQYVRAIGAYILNGQRDFCKVEFQALIKDIPPGCLGEALSISSQSHAISGSLSASNSIPVLPQSVIAPDTRKEEAIKKLNKMSR